MNKIDVVAIVFSFSIIHLKLKSFNFDVSDCKAISNVIESRSEPVTIVPSSFHYGEKLTPIIMDR